MVDVEQRREANVRTYNQRQLQAAYKKQEEQEQQSQAKSKTAASKGTTAGKTQSEKTKITKSEKAAALGTKVGKQKTEEAKTTIEKLRTEAPRRTTPTPTTTPKNYTQRYTNPKYTYKDVVQNFYDKSKFPSQSTQIKYLKSQGIENVNKYKAKSLGEALNRVAYVLTETAGGGVREATFGLSGGFGVENRPGGNIYQIAGGIATPTAADYMAGYAVSKLGITKQGRKLINKIMDSLDDNASVKFSSEEARMWEKIVGKNGFSTEDLRKANKNQLKKTMAQVIEYYEKNPNAPRVQSVLETYDDTVRTLDWDDDAYIDFLKTYGDNVDPNVVVPILFNAPPDSRVKVLEDVADYNITKPIPELMGKTKQPQVAEPSTGIDTIIKQEQPPSGGLGELPAQDIIEITPNRREPPKVVPEIIPSDVPEDTPDKTPSKTPKPPTPPITLTKRQSQERRELNFKLFNGERTKYKIRYTYPSGSRGETIIVEARSLNEGLGKAQRIKKPSKTRATVIDIEEIRN